MRPHPDCLQLLPKPALPEVPGCGRKGVAGGARERAIAGPVLPPRVLIAGSDCRYRLSEQGRDLRSVVQGVIRGNADDRGRSKASRRPHRHLGCSSYLGIGPHSSPHVHMIVPGGGFSLDRKSCVECRPDFFLSVRVLSRLFRRLLLDKLTAAHKAEQLEFFGKHVKLADAKAFSAYLAPLRNCEWVVYCKRPFAGPEAAIPTGSPSPTGA